MTMRKKVATKVFIVVFKRATNRVAIPEGFYHKYSRKLPSKLTIANKFGHTIPGRIKVDDSSPTYKLTNSDFISRLYGYQDYAVGRLTYVSRGNFKLFVPVSSRYFDEYGPFASANDTESEADSDDDEVTVDEQSDSRDGYMNPLGKLVGDNEHTKFVKVQLVPKGLQVKGKDVNGSASDCNSVVGAYKP